MKKKNVDAVFSQLVVCAFLLCWACAILPVGASMSCEELSNRTNCTCGSLRNGKLQLECAVEREQQIGPLLGAINSSALDNLDKVIISQCAKPIDLLSPLPAVKIRSLQISGCGIKQVHVKAFDAMADTLEELILSNNSISIWPNVKNLPKLRSINLNHNLLRDIPEHGFDGLGQLRQLRLKGNRICILLPNALSETKATLELLDLSKNCLSNVPSQNFKNATALTHLSLAGNQISVIAASQFVNMPNLKELRLSSNGIKGIAPRAFVNLPSLEKLNLANNQLEFIDRSTFDWAKNLTELRLSSNRIKGIGMHTFANTPLLTTLNLANNSLEYIERNTFEGAKGMKHLLLHGNAIVDVNNGAFSSTSELVVIDLAGNKLQKIRNGTFAKLNLFFLDLSNNSLSTFESGAFKNRVANMFVDGNPLNCDAELEWFVTYLVKNNVRVFVPSRPPVMCAAPPRMTGVSLKQLVMKKANQTLATSMDGGDKGGVKQQPSFLAKLLPGLANGGGGGGGSGSIPALSSITQALPSLRELPELNFLNQKGGVETDESFDRALKAFSDPLVKMATGGEPGPGEINQLLKSIPNLLVNIPGIGAVDISKLPPNMIEHILRGGPVPGLPQETLQTIVKQYMERMYYAAAKAQNLPADDVAPIPEGVPHSKYLIPLSELPQRFVANVTKGEPLPHLTARQTDVIKSYYMMQVPDANDGVKNNLTELFSPKVIQMMKLLPRGYDLSKLSPEVMKSVLAGEMPDFAKLPVDLQQHLKDNMDSLFYSFSETPGMPIDEVLDKLPRFNVSVGPTFSPYDINKVEPDLVSKGDDDEFSAGLYTAIALGLVGTATVVVLGIFFYNVKTAREATLASMASNF